MPATGTPTLPVHSTATAASNSGSITGTATSQTGSAAATSSAFPEGNVTPAPGMQPPTSAILRTVNSCSLIDSNDLAHLFPPHNEIVRDQPKTGPVSHPPFSKATADGTETDCLFYDFHQPGKITGWMLQVTYLVDVPAPSAVQAWSQAWANAKAKSEQPVSSLGDEAFASGANLFIRMGDTCVTFKATETQLDEKSIAGVQRLLAYEKQLAEAGLDRLK